MLRLYSGPLYKNHQHEVEEIIDLDIQKIVRRFGKRGLGGFVSGLEVSQHFEAINTNRTCKFSAGIGVAALFCFKRGAKFILLSLF